MGFEPTSPHYGCGILAAGRSVPGLARHAASSAGPVGSDGLEPSPPRVRTECAAANTLIPFQFVAVPSRKEAAVRVPCRDGMSTVWTAMGSEGFEPPPGEVKARHAAVTPRPRTRTWLRLSVMSGSPSFASIRGHSSFLPANHREVVVRARALWNRLGWS